MNAWSTSPLGELCKLVNGRAFKPTDWTKTGLPIVRIQNLNDSTKRFNRYSHPVDPKHKIDTGNVLLAWSGTPSTSFGCFVWDRGVAILNQHIFRVHVNSERMLEEFFVYAVNSRLDEMIRLAHGGVGRALQDSPATHPTPRARSRRTAHEVHVPRSRSLRPPTSAFEMRRLARTVVRARARLVRCRWHDGMVHEILALGQPSAMVWDSHRTLLQRITAPSSLRGPARFLTKCHGWTNSHKQPKL